MTNIIIYSKFPRILCAFFITTALTLSSCEKVYIDTYPTDNVPQYTQTEKTDVVYKQTDEGGLVFDVYYPTKRLYEKNPVLFAFHGGGWISGHRSSMISSYEPLMDKLRGEGYMVITVEYRFCLNGVAFPAPVLDCMDAISYLCENAKDFDADTENLGVIGYSAGAQLAAMCAYAPDSFPEGREYPDTDYSLRYCVSLAGPMRFEKDDMSTYSDTTLGYLHALIGGEYEALEDQYKAAGPYEYFDDGRAASLMLVQGQNDSVVPPSQADEAYEQAKYAGLTPKLIKIDNCTHQFSPADSTKDLGLSEEELYSEIYWFIANKYLPKTRKAMYRILEKKKLNSQTYFMKIEAPLIARKAQSGQFVILRTNDNGERIPLTIADFDRAAGWVAIIFQAVGKTTMELSEFEEGQSLRDFTGPLGIPTELEGYKKVAVVGGGVGCAIAYPQAKHLCELGAHVDMIAGFRNSDMIILEDEMRAVSDSLTLLTDDGSNGNKGLVTDGLKKLIENGAGYDLVVAIGPPIMMKFVSALTKRYGIKTLVSLNPIMIDGTGMCGGCRVTVGGKIKFACVDGPDFDGHEVDFDELMARLRIYKGKEQKDAESHSCRLNNIK